MYVTEGALTILVVLAITLSAVAPLLLLGYLFKDIKREKLW